MRLDLQDKEKKSHDKEFSLAVKEDILPAAFIKDGYIRVGNRAGDESYEDYLRELLNISTWFMNKTGGEKFIKPENEEHGENDAITQHYSLDFKLILGTSAQHARAMCSQQISTNQERSMYAYGRSRTAKPMQSIRLHVAFRSYHSIKELQDLLCADENKMDDIEKDVMIFINSILKPKNLFLLYPAILTYNGDAIVKAEDFCKLIYKDYKCILALRGKEFPNKETYIGFFNEGKLIVSMYEKGKLSVKDTIKATCSPTFNRIADVYDMNPLIMEFIK